MGIVDSLTKLVDPIAARERDAELKVTREMPKREGSGAPPELVCRICGHRSTEGPFCPVCLAETMERVPRSP